MQLTGSVRNKQSESKEERWAESNGGNRYEKGTQSYTPEIPWERVLLLLLLHSTAISLVFTILGEIFAYVTVF